MLKKIFYTKLSQNGSFKPYLNTGFYNPKAGLATFQFSLVDSGADSTLIPYSLGVRLGLAEATNSELQRSLGVSGSLLTARRSCQIALLNSTGSHLLVFDTDIHWAHPSEEELRDLKMYYSLYNNLKARNPKHTALDVLKKKAEIIQFRYETNVLLGRNFFRNFEFLQFVEKTRGDTSKFIYKIRKSKISRSVKLPQQK